MLILILIVNIYQVSITETAGMTLGILVENFCAVMIGVILVSKISIP